MSQREPQSHESKLDDTPPYVPPKIKDLSDGTTPMAVAPGAQIPSGSQ